MTSPFFHDGLILDNIGISTVGLAVRTYFQKFQYILLPYVTVWFGRLPHYRESSQFFPEVQMLVHIYEVLFYYKIIYFDIDMTILYISL